MNKFLLVAAGTVATGLAFGAAAPMAAPMNHWYVGVGLNHYTGTTEKLNNVDNYGDTNFSEKLDKTKIGYNLFVGNHVTKHFGTELGLNVLGDRTYKYYPTDGSNVGEYSKVKDSWNVYYDGIFTFPVMNAFSVYGKAGVNYYAQKFTTYVKVDGKKIVNDHPYTGKFKSFGWNYGAGVQYVYRQFGVRADYTHMNFTQDQEDNFNPPNLVGVDLFYNFG